MRFLAAFFILVLANASPPQGIRGRVVDEVTRKPIEGAWVVAGELVTRTRSDGTFEAVANKPDQVRVRAVGYARVSVAGDIKKDVGLTPLRVRGLYLSFWGAGSKLIRSHVLDTAAKAHLNAIVVDIKGDRGFISCPIHSDLAKEAGANRVVTMPDPAAFVDDLHKRGLYVIGRIVVFKDNPVARARPDLAVKTGSGGLFIDREGLGWTDPFDRRVWDYNIQIALEAARNGFDEIEYDYVRFPDRKDLRFAKESTEANRREAISGFLELSRNKLALRNVALSVDNFGYVCWNLNDTGIGQCLADSGAFADYLSPMLYPSSFQFGIPGLRNPVSDPYKIVHASLERAKQRTGYAGIVFRPWLQAFSDYAFDHRKFGLTQLEQQIRAAEDSGASGWLLWDPRNVYDPPALAQLAPQLWWKSPPERGGTLDTGKPSSR